MRGRPVLAVALAITGAVPAVVYGAGVPGSGPGVDGRAVRSEMRQAADMRPMASGTRPMMEAPEMRRAMTAGAMRAMMEAPAMRPMAEACHGRHPEQG